MTGRSKPLTFADVIRLAIMLPGVEESTSYGTPALKVKGKLIARLWEDGHTLVLRLPFVVRDHLIATAPAAFFLTDHYVNYPYVLVRLGVVRAAALQPLLLEAWRQVAPKRMVSAYDTSSG
jgi:hypothetical protein